MQFAGRSARSESTGGSTHSSRISYWLCGACASIRSPLLRRSCRSLWAFGACLAAFQLIDALLLRPLPVAAPGRLYVLSRQEFQSNRPAITRDNWQYPVFRRLSVLQRRREIGIRMALGAPPRDLAARVTARIFSMVLRGAVTGLALGLASVRYIEPLLYQVRSTELPVLLFPAFAILGTAVLAALPAIIHAVQIDPASLLRTE